MEEQETIIIRRILPADNVVMANIIRESLTEFNLNIPGTAYYDNSTDHLYESFLSEGTAYFIAEQNKEVIAGAGIFPTDGLPDGIVELVKMYVAAPYRGEGVGKKLMLHCIKTASDLGYRDIYLETMPELSAAVSAYKKLGFKELKGPLGNTGHYSCTIWMLRNLYL